MTWFKVDDKLHDHRKARAAGSAAMGVWVLAGSWAADNLTDGFIPATILPRWGRPRDAKRLVDVGLWYADEQDGEAGWRFHEWHERQPSRAQKLAERAVRAEAGKAGGVASGRSRREANGKQVASPLLEPPTRPDPSRPKEEARKRAVALPETFRPSEKHVAMASELGVDLRREWPKFTDYHRAKGSTMKDWSAALNNWIRKASEFSGVPTLRLAPNGEPVIPFASDDRR